MLRTLGRVSRLINRLARGEPGQTLCARIAAARGHDCLFCRVVGWVLRDPDHCWAERVLDLRRGRTTKQ